MCKLRGHDLACGPPASSLAHTCHSSPFHQTRVTWTSAAAGGLTGSHAQIVPGSGRTASRS